MSSRSLHRTWAEIDLDALRANAQLAQRLTGSTAPAVLAVVKADAYGTGAAAAALALDDLVAGFAVANTKEAAELRRAGVTRPLMLLGPALPHELEEAVTLGCCMAVSDTGEAEHIAGEACRQGKRAEVHIVIDTGMGRIGALPPDAAALIARVQELSWLRLHSVASHFSAADEDEAFTQAQDREFRRLLIESRIETGGRHIANSAGLLSGHCAPGDWVRAGILLYGVSPLPEHQPLLQPVMTWKSRVTLVRTLPAGWGISYGRTCVLDAAATVATVAAGYGDGYPRQLSGHGADVLIAGRRCPILGRVTMDQIMVDVSHLPGPVRPGDEVVLMGRQGSGEITAQELAAKAGTISWHVFTGITDRTARCHLRAREAEDI